MSRNILAISLLVIIVSAALLILDIFIGLQSDIVRKAAMFVAVVSEIWLFAEIIKK
jgi:hypothetical protein